MSGAVVSVGVTLVVRPAGTIASLEHVQAAGCTPSRLAITQTGLVNNFSVPAKWPAAIVVKLNDDCGGSVTNGSVKVAKASPMAIPPLFAAERWTKRNIRGYLASGAVLRIEHGGHSPSGGRDIAVHNRAVDWRCFPKSSAGVGERRHAEQFKPGDRRSVGALGPFLRFYGSGLAREHCYARAAAFANFIPEHNHAHRGL